jgi:serine/threonine protein kinase/tetratricopeptide (TPR) repeat protein
MATWNPRANELFLKALDLRSPGEREAYLDEVCAGDAALRAEVDGLLEAGARAGSFLEPPARDPAATFDEGPTIAEDPGTVIGPYKLLKPIGEGGFAVVFLAEQTRPVRRRVAVKVLKPGMDTRQVVARFEAERQALAIMDHPNIAKVFDGGTTPSGRPYFVMELVKGVPITAFCDQKQLTPRQRLGLFVSVCQAVQHAHQKGVIHRDLKPSNVLVTLNDTAPVVKVIDFGVAKALGQELTDKTLFTGFAQMIGTPLYMSPEQAGLSGLDIDTRSDIYALGVLLYELLTGTTPFPRERFKQAGYDEIRRIIREEEPPRPSTRLSTLGQAATTICTQRQSDPRRLSRLFRGELDWVVMKALEKDRNRRYETANSFAGDVQRYLNDEPVAAGPPSALYRFRKLAHKHRKVLATAAAFGLLLVTATGVSIGLAVWALRAQQVATGAAAAERTAREGETKEKQLAQQHEREAKEAAAARQDVLDFFDKKILAAVRPRGQKGGLGPDVTVRQAIEAAEPQIAAAFKDRPAVEASVRDTMGLSYWYAGEHDLAIRQYQQALALRQAALGPDHPDTLKTLNNLATAYADSGKPEQALPLLQDVLKRQQATLGPDHADVLITMNNIAEAYMSLGRADEAIALHEETLRLKQARLGPDDLSTLISMNNLARAYRQVGRLDQAIPLLEEAHRRLKARYGPDHQYTLGCIVNLAGAYEEAHKFNQAVALLEETLPRMKAALPAGHPYILGTMNNLAGAYQAAGKIDRALPLREEAFRLFKAKFGLDHADTLRVMAGLADVYMDAGKVDQALPLLEEVVQRRKAKLGADSPDTLLAMTDLGSGYQAAGKLQQALPLFEAAATGIEKRNFHSAWAGRIIHGLTGCQEQLQQFAHAEAWHRKWLAAVKERSGTDSLAYAEGLAGLGRNLLLQERWADAEQVLRECLTIQQQKQPDAWTTFDTRSMLGSSLAGQKRFTEAEPLLLEGYEGMNQRAASIPAKGRTRLTDAIERLVRLYEGWGRKDQADAWRRKREAAHAAAATPSKP